MLEQGLQFTGLQSLDILPVNDRSDSVDGEKAVAVGVLLVQSVTECALEAHEQLARDDLQLLGSLSISLSLPGGALAGSRGACSPAGALVLLSRHQVDHTSTLAVSQVVLDHVSLDLALAMVRVQEFSHYNGVEQLWIDSESQFLVEHVSELLILQVAVPVLVFRCEQVHEVLAGGLELALHRAYHERLDCVPDISHQLIDDDVRPRWTGRTSAVAACGTSRSPLLSLVVGEEFVDRLVIEGRFLLLLLLIAAPLWRAALATPLLLAASTREQSLKGDLEVLLRQLALAPLVEPLHELLLQ